MMRFLVCDDHPLVREALGGTLRLAWPGAEVTPVADFPAAWAAAASRPDLVLCDLVMPGAAPLEGIDGVLRAAPGVPLLVVTGTEDDALMLQLLQRGVAGFVPKSSSGAVIEAAVRLVLAGGRYLPPRLAEIALLRAAPAPATPPQRLTARLTGRQIEILRLLAQGQSNKEIARVLSLSPSTVKTHIAQVLLCLGASNRSDAAERARQLNLIPAGEDGGT